MSTREEAVSAAMSFLGPGATRFIEDPAWDWNVLLPQAVTRDEDGRLPNEEGWIPSYDAHWLGGLAAEQLARWTAGSNITIKLSVDGDSREIRPSDWSAVADSLYGQSPLYQQGDLFVDGHLTDYIPTSAGLL